MIKIKIKDQKNKKKMRFNNKMKQRKIWKLKINLERNSHQNQYLIKEQALKMHKICLIKKNKNIFS